MQKITESEMIIMDIIWDAGKQVTSAFVLGNLRRMFDGKQRP